jgi:hypothetical protein
MDTGAGWTPCIVTVFDLIGTKKQALSGTGSKLMLHMHRCAAQRIRGGLPLHSQGYIWNDSVLLLSEKASTIKERLDVLLELEAFKLGLQEECEAGLYAISVKGKTFPPVELPPAKSPKDAERAVILKTSSWAMANCFAIEQALRKHRADWYLDSRLTRGLKLPEMFKSEPVELLPDNEPRDIHMYKGRLFKTYEAVE